MTDTESTEITCQICGAKAHSIQLHLKSFHPEMTIEVYQQTYPDAPLLSDKAREKLAAARKKSEKSEAAKVPAGSGAFHKIFNLGSSKAALNAKGDPIPISMPDSDPAYAEFIPEIDKAHVYDIALLKDVIMGMELNIPTYLWGHAGTGKTSLHRQVAARTGRPLMRIQHTINTEESHIVGQWLVRKGETIFELGPLSVCMKYGLVYCADEYDMALPSVLSVYQPVLEGEPLVIKEADAENRVIKPHPNFRFTATGNTNGCGDETGLYQGTHIGNAANYERFGIVRRVEYMTKSQEVEIVANQSDIPKSDAEVMVEFATEIRKAYEGSKIGMTISPRALINAAMLGIRRGDYKIGLQLAFSNRLTAVDQEIADNVAQRLFA